MLTLLINASIVHMKSFLVTFYILSFMYIVYMKACAYVEMPFLFSDPFMFLILEYAWMVDVVLFVILSVITIAQLEVFFSSDYLWAMSPFSCYTIVR